MKKYPSIWTKLIVALPVLLFIIYILIFKPEWIIVGLIVVIIYVVWGIITHPLQKDKETTEKLINYLKDKAKNKHIQKEE